MDDKIPMAIDPLIPETINIAMLNPQAKLMLRALPKDLAEKVGLNLATAHYYMSSNYDVALEYARTAVRLAPRIDISRELLGILAYRTGEYRLAIREISAAHRINGNFDLYYIMGDCLRGLGEPKKAIELLSSSVLNQLSQEDRIEALFVKAGALKDLGNFREATSTISRELREKNLNHLQRAELNYAKVLFCIDAGIIDETHESLDTVTKTLDKLFELTEQDVVIIDIEDEFDYETQYTQKVAAMKKKADYDVKSKTYKPRKSDKFPKNAR